MNENHLFTTLLTCYKEDGALSKGKKKSVFALLWEHYETKLKETLDSSVEEEDAEDALWLFHELFSAAHRSAPLTLQKIDASGISVSGFMERFLSCYAAVSRWLDENGYPYFRKEERWLALRQALISQTINPLLQFPQADPQQAVLQRLLAKQKEAAAHPVDAAIISGMGGGMNKKVMLDFYKESKTVFFNRVLKRGYPGDWLQDALQNAWVVLIANYLEPGKIRREGPFLIGLSQEATLQTLLLTIGQNMLAKRSKRTKSTLFPGDESLELIGFDPESEKSDRIEKEVKMNDMTSSIKSLPERDQELLRLFYEEARSFKEIAGIMGYANENVARQRKFRIILKLQKLLGI